MSTNIVELNKTSHICIAIWICLYQLSDMPIWITTSYEFFIYEKQKNRLNIFPPQTQTYTYLYECIITYKCTWKRDILIYWSPLIYVRVIESWMHIESKIELNEGFNSRNINCFEYYIHVLYTYSANIYITYWCFRMMMYGSL